MANSESDIAVVGAGPYGLSIAASLTAAGHDVRVFGRPMQTWAEAMPAGMRLKSDGFASNLIAPAADSTLAAFCAARGIPYDDKIRPVTLETFVAYGQEFQRRFVSGLDPSDIALIEGQGAGFRLVSTSGDVLRARRVILALGVTHFRTMPPFLAGLPPDLVSHSADHHRFDRFAGQRVAVLGAGASATDVAAALIGVGARVTLLSRTQEVRFSSPPPDPPPGLIQRLKSPSSLLGPGWRSRLVSDLPGLFRLLPDALRLQIVDRHLGPRSAWYLRDGVMGGADVRTGVQPHTAVIEGAALRLQLRGADGADSTLVVDHLVAATGYWPQVSRLQMLAPALRGAIAQVEGVPVLSADFESSVPGLYLTGLAAAGSFGPLMRFVAGAAYTTHRLCRHFRDNPVSRTPRPQNQTNPEAEPA